MHVKKITIVSLYGCGNIGDEAILASMLNLFFVNMRATLFYVLAISPIGCRKICFPSDLSTEELTRRIHSIFHVHMQERRGRFADYLFKGAIIRIIATLISTDVLLFGGGYWLHDYKWYNLPLIAGLSVTAKLFGKKVIFYAIGAGPIRTFTGRMFIMLLIKCADAIMVRDRFSFDSLERIKKSNKIYLTGDAACSLERPQEGLVHRVTGGGRIVLGFNVSAWFEISNLWSYQSCQFADRYMTIASMLDRLVLEHDLEIIFLPTMLPEDRVACREILTMMKRNIAARVLYGDLNPSELMSIIGGLDLVVAMRLHPLIFGAIMNVPSIAIAYDPKVSDFMMMMGRSEWCLGIGDVNGIPDLVTRLLDGIDRHKLITQNNFRKLYQGSLKNFEIFEKII